MCVVCICVWCDVCGVYAYKCIECVCVCGVWCVYIV